MGGSVRIRALCAALVAAAVGCVALAMAPSAFAAPPANDDFANRQVLEGPLPIEVNGSNVEATKEEGESLPGLAPAGHSVWFQWEATSTGWVTIGACDDEFPTILAVFTGSELGNLTQVAKGNAAEGPDCPFQSRQYTFKATSGTTYAIAVDGNAFFVVGPPPPVTEGEIVLRIEETPPPPNDDFANAEKIEAPVSEEPGGNRVYVASVNGYNWKATTEPGEQSYGAGSGASAWYSWTPPESGSYRFGGPCCGLGLDWGLYAGDSVDALAQVLAATGSAEAAVSAGTTYHLVVYGTPDLATEEPSMADFDFLISAELPPLPRPQSGPGPPAPQSDRTPPETKMDRSRILVSSRLVRFWFSASEPAGGFLCQLDKAPFKACGPPREYRHLDPGAHAFRVKAVDLAGNVDGSAAIARFKIPRPTEHSHRSR
jgi:hypothetical protein